MSTCQICMHFVAHDAETGICRRYPPTPLALPTKNALGQQALSVQPMWSPVNVEDICGEFRPPMPKLVAG